MEKLVELANSQIFVNIYYGNHSRVWYVTLEKEVDGAKLKISAEGDHPATVLDEAYAKWLRLTSGNPDLSLNQIEYQEVSS